MKVALRQREQLATLRVREGVLVLNTMLWPDEIRAADFDVPGRGHHGAAAGVGDGHVADRVDGRPTSSRTMYTDDYREALQEVIDAKVSGREVVTPPDRGSEAGGARST